MFCICDVGVSCVLCVPCDVGVGMGAVSLVSSPIHQGVCDVVGTAEDCSCAVDCCC